MSSVESQQKHKVTTKPSAPASFARGTCLHITEKISQTERGSWKKNDKKADKWKSINGCGLIFLRGKRPKC